MSVLRASVGVAVAGAMLVVLGACETAPRGDDEQSVRPVAPLVPPPTIATIAGVYNQRVKDLARLRSPLSMLIDRPDENDASKRTRDQVEGSMQWVLPSRMSLRVDKVGQTLFWLGSNEDNYWSIDVHSEPPVALVGTHERLSPRTVALLGLPAHPLDLLEALCVTPLREQGTSVRWGRSAGTVLVTTTGRMGVSVERTLDATTYEPRAVTLRAAGGEVLINAALSRVVSVPVVGDFYSKAALAADIALEMPEAQTTVTLLLKAPENPGTSLREKPFDLEGLLRTYRVEDVRNLDERNTRP